jgi:hypothetical protein
VLTVLGVLSTIVGLGLSVLALGDVGRTGAVILRESAGTTAALAALWVLALCHEMDLRSGFTSALDATRPGALGRYGGRLVGAVAVSVLASLPTVAVGSWVVGAERPSTIYLLITIIPSVLLLVSWALLLLVTTSSGQAALLAGLALWVAGHLPWGQPAWGGRAWGRIAAALLPGGAAASELVATLGLLLLGASLLRRTPLHG